MDVTAYDLVRAMEATEWQRSQIQGFAAPKADVPKLYIRDCLLPRGDQRVWERPYEIDLTYETVRADMMREIKARQYQKALDWLATEQANAA